MTATHRTEEYLESIFKLQQASHPVSVTRLAQHLALSPPSVSEMLKKLESDGYVFYREKGVCLTAKGEREARHVVRRHRLSERLLTDILGFKWHEVHDEACRLEHAISPKLEEMIERTVSDATTCPHGHPIPDRNGTIRKENTKPLSELGIDHCGIIVSVFEEDPGMLQYLASLGLIPRTHVKIEQVAPFNGPLLVEVGGVKYALGREVASRIRVREVD